MVGGIPESVPDSRIPKTDVVGLYEETCGIYERICGITKIAKKNFWKKKNCEVPGKKPE